MAKLKPLLSSTHICQKESSSSSSSAKNEKLEDGQKSPEIVAVDTV